jgi:glucose-6-phosphate 1-dehydrogenase
VSAALDTDGPPPHPNHLRCLMKPGGEVALEVQVKAPGSAIVSHPVELAYRYDAGSESPRAEAYEQLLADALDGDPRLFARADGVEEAWRIVAPGGGPGGAMS